MSIAEYVAIPDLAIETGTTKYMRQRSAGVVGLKPTLTTGNIFDGTLQEASLGVNAFGHIYGASPRFKDGAFIETSKIVFVGQIESVGWFIETIGGSRYLVSSISFNSSLRQITESIEAAMHNQDYYIDINIDYFKPLKWSQK
jgi:hypothetical protein